VEAVSAGELQFLIDDAIVPDLRATTKEEAIREILVHLASSGAVDANDLDGAAQAILSREELGSTGIGHGVAIPHASLPSVCREVGAVAGTRQGIDFNSRDGRPVHLIFLLLSPPDNPSDQVQALAGIARYLRSRGVPA
jgi:mannitol/fructose-specific phosphotransferase system IIA component (Ntr-type)